MNGAASALAEVAVTVAADAAGPADLYTALLPATVYCERGALPGFRALGPPGNGMVPVFTSPEQLALARGAVEWFSLLGSDLLGLLPAGYDILLDVAGATPLLLRPNTPGLPAVARPAATGG